MTCAAVIPCFNEEKTIGPLVRALLIDLPLVIVVDDGSKDKTAIRAGDAGAMVIPHESNRGKGAALRTGLSQLHKFGFERAVVLDGDGQHDPAEVSALVQCAEQTGATLVIGNRMWQAEAMPWLRRQVNRWMSRKLSQSAGQARHLPDTQSGFRLMHLPTWASLSLSAQRFEVESEMLMAFLAGGFPVEFVPIRVIAAARKSRIRPITDSLRWWAWWRKRNPARRPETGISAPCTVLKKMVEG